MNSPQLNNQLKDVLQNILSSIIKCDNGAFCSSETHLNMAVVKLLSLIDQFNASGEEANILLFAIGEVGTLQLNNPIEKQ